MGLTLASGWFGVRVGAVAALGIKVAWSDEELSRARTLAGRPNPVLPTRAEAAERFLKVAGLTGLVGAAAVDPAAVARSLAAGLWPSTRRPSPSARRTSPACSRPPGGR